MKHNFYANNRMKNAINKQICAMKTVGFRSSYTPKKNMIGKSNRIISAKADAAIKAYSDDSKVQSEIADEVRMYRINLTLAHQYKDKKAEKNLTREIVSYLDKKIKEKR